MRGRYEAVQSRGKRIGSAAVVLVVTAALFLYHWTYEAAQEAHTMPQVERYDIYAWCRQRQLAKPQLRVVAEQTGVNEEVVSRLLKEGKWQLLLELQGAYFAEVKTESEPGSIVTVSEYVVDERGRYTKGTQLAEIQDGDILITKNSRFLGWRNGHAGLVVDAEEGLVLEAIMLGTDTKLCSVEKWLGYPAFQVLRLKTEEGTETGELAAVYAKEYLVDIPYQLWAGIRGRLFRTKAETAQSNQPVLKGTQCAHLVWYAYKQVGIDLDSDGGILVTPTDIQNSPYLEVVQSYGYEKIK